MTGANQKLDVYLGEQAIADLSFIDDQLRWRYLNEWQRQGFAVSPHLPLSNDIPSVNTQRFVRNLLPEGNALEELINAFSISKSNTFGLIRKIGQETTGALTFLPPDMQPRDDAEFRLLKGNELAERLAQRGVVNLTIWDSKPRLSVTGLQDKLNVVIRQPRDQIDGQAGDQFDQMGFGEGTLCSTHILKFERQQQTHLVLNEFITMRLAALCELPVAKVDLKQYGAHRALLVERFDRRLVDNETVQRRHVIDGCQALNLSPEAKYERNFGSGRDVAHIRDGASLPRLFAFSGQCSNPAATRQTLLDWLLFNLLVCNYDAHGKNVSFFVNANGISLAPFYDLVNIAMYPMFDQSLSMALGDEFESANINGYQLADFAESCQLTRRLVADRLQRMISNVLENLPTALQLHQPNDAEASYLNHYTKIVKQHCKHFLSQINLLPTMQV